MKSPTLTKMLKRDIGFLSAINVLNNSLHDSKPKIVELTMLSETTIAV